MYFCLWITLRELFARTFSLTAFAELRTAPVVARRKRRVVPRSLLCDFVETGTPK